MKPKPPYCHIAQYPMPIVSAPQPLSLEADLPGEALDLAALDGGAWWVRYEVVNPFIGIFVKRPPTQVRGFPAVPTDEVREELTEIATNARGMGRPWPGLATSFDPDAQVIYVRYGEWLWTDAGISAFARVA